MRTREWQIDLALRSCNSSEPILEFLNAGNVLSAMDAQAETTPEEAAEQVASVTTPEFVKICTEGENL